MRASWLMRLCNRVLNHSNLFPTYLWLSPLLIYYYDYCYSSLKKWKTAGRTQVSISKVFYSLTDRHPGPNTNRFRLCLLHCVSVVGCCSFFFFFLDFIFWVKLPGPCTSLMFFFYYYYYFRVRVSIYFLAVPLWPSSGTSFGAKIANTSSSLIVSRL